MSDITQSFSQLLLTYGPGAMLDLPDHAVVVAGLQDWRYGAGWQPLSEDRLVPLLRQQLGDKLSPTFNGLRQPPAYDEERHDSYAPGVEVRLFPTWFIVDDKGPAEAAEGDGASTDAEKRRRIVEFLDLSVTKGGKLAYKGDAKKADVNPIRFVGACAKGHLQDIDWRRLTHRNGDQSCRKPLHWVERGVSSDPSDIAIRCTCGAQVTLSDLYKPYFLGGCACQSPWLTPRWVAEEVCDKELKLLPRSATNTYFAQTITVISLSKSDDRVRQLVAEHGQMIASIRQLPNFLTVLRSLPQTSEAFREFSDDEVMRALADAAEEEAVVAPCVDGSPLARVSLDCGSVGRCGHVFDLLVRHIKPLAIMPPARTGPDQFRALGGAVAQEGFPVLRYRPAGCVSPSVPFPSSSTPQRLIV